LAENLPFAPHSFAIGCFSCQLPRTKLDDSLNFIREKMRRFFPKNRLPLGAVFGSWAQWADSGRSLRCSAVRNPNAKRTFEKVIFLKIVRSNRCL